MTDTIDPVDEFLSHHGVKGMHWGHRKDQTSGGGSSSSGPSKKVIKKDKKFEKSAGTRDTLLAVHNGAARSMNAKLRDINTSPKYNGKNLNKDPKLAAQYEADVAKEWSKSLHESAASLGTNASGTRQYAVEEHDDNTWSVTTKEVKHAGDEVQLYRVTKNAQGFITSITPIVSSVEHNAMVAEEFLQHFGVKGMKWGVRHHGGVTTGSPRAKLPASKDSEHASALSSKVKKGGTAALSNDELKTLVKRMQLEGQYKDLNTKTVGEGEKIVKDLLVNAGKQQASMLISKGAAKGADYLTKKVLEAGKK